MINCVHFFQACRIPKLDVNAPAVTKFFSRPRPLTCHLAEKNWAYVDGGKFYISDEAVRLAIPTILCIFFLIL